MSVRRVVPRPRLTPEQQARVRGALYVVQRLTLHYAKRLRLNPDQRDEIFAVGSQELTEAAIPFQPSRDTDFNHYAWRRVAGAMLRVLGRERAHHAAASRVMLLLLERPIDSGNPFTDSDDDAADRAADGCARAALGLFAGRIGLFRNAAGEDEIVARESYVSALQVLKEEMARLEADDARLLDARYCQAETWAAVAAGAGVSQATAKRRAADALAKLKLALRARGILSAPAPLDRIEHVG